MNDEIRIVLSENGAISFYGDLPNKEGGVYITPEDEHKTVSDMSTSPDVWAGGSKIIAELTPNEIQVVLDTIRGHLLREAKL